MKSVKKSCN